MLRANGWTCTAAAICAVPWVLATGCASAPLAQASAASVAQSDGIGRDGGNHISPAELQSVRSMWALDAVRRLRPEFLRASARTMGQGDQASPVLYVNRVYVGDVSWLATVPVSEIKDIAFLQPTEGRVRFGSTCVCTAGVLAVEMGSRRR